jgi:1-phosphofructokinase
LTATAVVAGPNTPLDAHHACDNHVLGGGPFNASRAFDIVAAFLGLDWRPRTLTFIGEDDRSTIEGLLGASTLEDILFVPGLLRRNAITMRDGQEHTEYGESTIEVSDEDVAALVQKISQAEPGSWCGLTGSLPEGMSVEYFFDVISVLQALGVGVALDTRGHLLKALLGMNCFPNVIFPNKSELSLIVGEQINALDDDQLLRLTSDILPPGGIVTASLGPDGVFLRRGDRAWRVQADLPPGVEDVTRNGCGDALFGGTLAGLNAAGLELSDDQLVWAVMLGVAAATAAMASVTPAEFSIELFRIILRDHLVVTQVQ